MNRTQHYIEEIRKALEKELNKRVFDKGIRERLGIAPSRFSRLKNGEEHFNEDQILLVAQYVRVPATQILIEIAEDKAKTEEAKEAWGKALTRLIGGFVGTALLSGVLVAKPEKVTAAQFNIIDNGIYYANRLRKWLALSLIRSLSNFAQMLRIDINAKTIF